MRAFVRCAIESAIGNVGGVESSCMQPRAESKMERSVLSITIRMDFLFSLSDWIEVQGKSTTQCRIGVQRRKIELLAIQGLLRGRRCSTDHGRGGFGCHLCGIVWD